MDLESWSEDDYRRRRAYCGAVALSVGVPYHDLEDAIQDMFERAVRSGRYFPLAMRRAAIDAVRRYVGDRRRAVSRVRVGYLDFVDLEAPGVDVDRLIDFARAWDRLDPERRALLLEEVDPGPRPFDAARASRVYRARRRLADLMAG